MLVRATNPEITPLGTSKGLMSDSLFGHIPGPTPGSSGLSNGARFHVDSRGFWQYARGVGGEKPGWLLIGDSVTMGIGVRPDSTFAGILARSLSAELELLNPSLIGYASHHYRALVRHFLQSGHRGVPEIHRITIFWSLNDAYHSGQIDDPKGKFKKIAEPLLRFMRRYMYTYQWVKASFVDRPKRYYEHDTRLYSGESLDRAISDLSEIAALCDLHDILCDVVLLPYEYQLREPDVRPQRTLEARMADLSLRVHDPFRWILSRTDDPSSLFLYGDGIHFSDVGHRLIAEYVLDRVTPGYGAASEF